MAQKKADSKSAAKTPQQLEEIYRDFELKLAALKKEKDAAVSRIMRKIDDEKIKQILSKIK